MELAPEDVRIETLGPCKIDSPLPLSTVLGDGLVNFTEDQWGLRFDVLTGMGGDDSEVAFELAGPRERLFFNPSRVRAAVVTCGGLCPGLNNVIRSIQLELSHGYGVKEILGIRFGYRGLHGDSGLEPIALTSERVSDIHRLGGTMLGSSRGPGDVPAMVEFLRSRQIDMLFCLGGDGTQRGAHAIAEEVLRRELPIAVVGVPKTIDNDIPYVERTFGFSTAIEQARNVVDCAHAEARGADNGIAIVKLMGRHAGYIAAAATVASQEVNFVLVPEVPFALDGAGGFLAALEDRVVGRGHAVIAVAEGAGQDLVDGAAVGADESGNKLLKDIGLLLRGRIEEHFAAAGVPISIKYFDPSYSIRAVPADADDSVLCDTFARHAVHAAMAGKTDMVIGLMRAKSIHVPISLVARERKTMDSEGELWRAALAATGQPPRFAGS